MMLSYLRELASRLRRGTTCRRGDHTWTDMAVPPACLACGMPRPLSDSDEVARAAPAG